MALGIQITINERVFLMIIYLAGGMPVMNTKGRERELSKKWHCWNRLFSFHFLDLIHKSEILTITKENKNKQDNENKQNRIKHQYSSFDFLLFLPQNKPEKGTRHIYKLNIIR